MSMTIIWIGGGILLILVIVGVVVTITSEKELVEERIEQYLDASETGLEYESSPEDDWRRMKSPLGRNRMAQRSGFNYQFWQ